MGKTIKKTPAEKKTPAKRKAVAKTKKITPEEMVDIKIDNSPLNGNVGPVEEDPKTEPDSGNIRVHKDLNGNEYTEEDVIFGPDNPFPSIGTLIEPATPLVTDLPVQVREDLYTIRGDHTHNKSDTEREEEAKEKFAKTVGVDCAEGRSLSNDLRYVKVEFTQPADSSRVFWTKMGQRVATVAVCALVGKSISFGFDALFPKD